MASSTWVMLLLSMTWAGAWNSSAYAQTETTGQNKLRYSFDIIDASTQVALEQFVEHTQASLVYDMPLVSDKRSTCTVIDASLVDSLHCILEGTGLVAERLASGTFILRMKQDALPPQSTARHTLKGFVRDADTGEYLIGATVYEAERNVGATTNQYGFFSLTLPAGPTRILVSYLGYTPLTFNVHLDRDLTLPVQLSSHAYMLDSVVVEAASERGIEEHTQMSAVGIPVEQIESIPALLGEVDVIKAIQLLPGVQSGQEGASGLYVRGGGPDQNLILLDSAPLYTANHLFGYLSIFNPDAIRKVDLIKGGFPARYGGRLSSVLEISMKEGNMKRHVAKASLGVLSAHVLAEGPVVRDKAAFMVSARRSLIDVWAAAFADEDKIQRPLFYDVNAKINHGFSERDRLYLSMYLGRDVFSEAHSQEVILPGTGRFEEASRYRLAWGNALTTVRWNRLFSDRLFGSTLFLLSDYRFRTENQSESSFPLQEETVHELSTLRYNSGVRDVGLRLDFDFMPTPAHTIRFGARATHHVYTTGATQFITSSTAVVSHDTTSTPDAVISTDEVAFYFEDEVRLTTRLQANLGLHASGIVVEGQPYTSLQPRLAARYLLGGWGVKASYARTTQYVHLLTNSGLGLPTDLWVPSTKRIAPQRAQQMAAGLARSLKNGYEVSLEGYYKTMENLVEYREGAQFMSGGKNWQDNVAVGAGKAYRAEIFLQKKQGRTTGWLGYTLSWSTRQFDELNFGRTFPYKYDRRHDFALTLTSA